MLPYFTTSAEQFKGSKGYYQSDKVTNVEELLERMKATADSESLAGSTGATLDPKTLMASGGDRAWRESVMSTADLERILDRSPAAYAAPLPSGDGTGTAVVVARVAEQEEEVAAEAED